MRTIGIFQRKDRSGNIHMNHVKEEVQDVRSAIEEEASRRWVSKVAEIGDNEIGEIRNLEEVRSHPTSGIETEDNGNDKTKRLETTRPHLISEGDLKRQTGFIRDPGKRREGSELLSYVYDPGEDICQEAKR